MNDEYDGSDHRINNWDEYQRYLTDSGQLEDLPSDEPVSIVAIHTHNGSYEDFDHMLSKEGEPEFYEVEWSNGDLTSPDGEYLGKVVNDDSEGDEDDFAPHEPRIERVKTYAYKAHSRCRKCGTSLYDSYRDYTGNYVQRVPDTHYVPDINKLRKICNTCRFVWLELPKDCRAKSNG